MCHGDKTKSGAAKVAGSPQAMPADHFAKDSNKPDAMHNTCTMCHQKK